MDFKLKSNFKPSGDQPQAIEKIVKGILGNKKQQTLLGATGTGKTFTMANVIEKINLPTLVISHNKTLAAQLYEEFKHFFPDNAVHFFVSYYDYYQPEAYIPRTDTYIEKDASINEEIDRLRHAATDSLLTRNDAIIVSSVSCIYGIGEPSLYLEQSVNLKVGQKITRKELLEQLISIQYERNDIDFTRGRMRVRGETVDVFPAAEEEGKRIEIFEDKIQSIKIIDPLTGEMIHKVPEVTIFPAKHFVTTKENIKKAVKNIENDLTLYYQILKKRGKILEAERLKQRTNYDIEMMLETGYCSGIENYSIYFSDKKVEEPPFTLIDYFKYRNKNFLMLIDESHITLPQIRGMYNGDRSRKETLVENGFRLPTALDNRPLRFTEFEEREDFVVYTSATPGDFELKKCSGNITFTNYFQKRDAKASSGIIEQVIRPTGLTDPIIKVKPTEHQIDDLIKEIRERVSKKQRVFVTTLTKRMAEDLTDYLKEINIKVQYLHSDIHTLERPEILRDLRKGVYDVLIGINLLREGLDVPEVSLVAILDADKEGFLRSDQSLIQTIGRAVRHVEGEVIMYADKITGSMKRAIEETERRRKIQVEYNKKHNITPQTIKKAISEELKDTIAIEKQEIRELKLNIIPKDELKRLVKELETKMDLAAKNLEFEKAAVYRDQIQNIKEELEKKRFR